MDDTEQLDQLKDWWTKYGRVVFRSVVAVACTYLVLSWWFSSQERSIETASTYYQKEFLKSVQEEDFETMQAWSVRLKDEFTDSPYASMSALHMAKYFVDLQKYPEAEQQLKWVLEHYDNTVITDVVQARLARVYLAQNKAEEVLALFADNDAEYYAPIFDELRGDAYLLKGDRKSAYQAYKLALDGFKEKSDLSPSMLQIKLDNLSDQQQNS